MNKNVFRIAAVYTAMIIGAGFASGQELLQFFLRYGRWGFLGIGVSAFLIFLVGYAVLCISIKNGYDSQADFLRSLAGERLSIVIEVLIGFMFFVFYSAMVSAAGATLNQTFKLDFTQVTIIFSAVCFIALFFGVNGIIKINSVLVPLMLLGGMFAGLYIIFYETANAFSNTSELVTIVKNNWFSSALVYAAYNIVTSIAVLISVKDLAINRRTAKNAAIVSGVYLYLFGTVLLLSLYLTQSFSPHFEIPILAALHKHGYVFEYLYLSVLVMAIFTTAIGNGFAFINFLDSQTKLGKLNIKIILFFMGIIFAHIGFSNIVGRVYPVFALVGFFEIGIILFRFFKEA